LGRALGLLVRPRLGDGEALWLEPCNGVHSLGMAYPIAVVMLGRDGRVLKTVTSLRPWRVQPGVHGGRATIEMLPTTLAASSIRVGRRLKLVRYASPPSKA
jgi:uncharacterized membrane protein (UPF0127 family)